MTRSEPRARKIRIRAGEVEMSATLNASLTAQRIWDALPIVSQAKTWGDEIYFDIPVEADEEEPQARVPSGTIAYWPPGPAFCIFFGQTPYSPVNVLGQLDGNPREFARVQENETVRLERIPPG
jgi:hypothetical protein